MLATDIRAVTAASALTFLLALLAAAVTGNARVVAADA